MGSQSKVSVVIVNYNAGELLVALIRSLIGLPVQKIVVVDNGSSDNSVAELADIQHCQCIMNVENQGFAFACNQGVKSTTTELVLILNPDCEMSAGDLQQLIDVMQLQPQAGLCSPLVFDQQGLEQSGSRRHLPTPWRILQAYAGRPAALDLRTTTMPDTPLKLPATSGACMLVRRSAWDLVKGMDDGFFLHFEDLDLMLRMQQNGWGVWLQPSAKVTHLGGHSSHQQPIRVSYSKHISLLRYLRKHHPKSPLSWTIIPLLALIHFVLTLPAMLMRGSAEQ